LSLFDFFYENGFISLGAASTARALSAYFDSLINFSMQKFFITYLPIHSKLFSNYADIFAMGICLILTGRKTSLSIELFLFKS